METKWKTNNLFVQLHRFSLESFGIRLSYYEADWLGEALPTTHGAPLWRRLKVVVDPKDVLNWGGISDGNALEMSTNPSYCCNDLREWNAAVQAVYLVTLGEGWSSLPPTPSGVACTRRPTPSSPEQNRPLSNFQKKKDRREKRRREGKNGWEIRNKKTKEREERKKKQTFLGGWR